MQQNLNCVAPELVEIPIDLFGHAYDYCFEEFGFPAYINETARWDFDTGSTPDKFVFKFYKEDNFAVAFALLFSGQQAISGV